MAEDPFKVIKDPKLYPAPEKMKIPELAAFESIDMKRTSFTWKNIKGSAIYMGNIRYL